MFGKKSKIKEIIQKAPEFHAFCDQIDKKSTAWIECLSVIVSNTNEREPESLIKLSDKEIEDFSKRILLEKYRDVKGEYKAKVISKSEKFARSIVESAADGFIKGRNLF
jgi:hypothetical protein